MQGNGGTGLGLCIVRELLKLHSGSKLTISSEGEGKGAEFAMALNLELAGGKCDDALSSLGPFAGHADFASLPSDWATEPAASKGSVKGPADAEVPGVAMKLPAGFLCLHVEDDRIVQVRSAAALVGLCSAGCPKPLGLLRSLLPANLPSPTPLNQLAAAGCVRSACSRSRRLKRWAPNSTPPRTACARSSSWSSTPTRS